MFEFSWTGLAFYYSMQYSKKCVYLDFYLWKTKYLHVHQWHAKRRNGYNTMACVALAWVDCNIPVPHDEDKTFCSISVNLSFRFYTLLIIPKFPMTNMCKLTLLTNTLLHLIHIFTFSCMRNCFNYLRHHSVEIIANANTHDNYAKYVFYWVNLLNKLV